MIKIEREEKQRVSKVMLPQVWVEPDLKEALQVKMKEQGLTRYSEVIRQLLRLWIGGVK